ncbi:hypothetical protein P3X46_033849, partial [Hevea brasiliensis]
MDSFSVQKCREIVKIPIANRVVEPKLVWHYSKFRIPSVKAVYFHLKKNQFLLEHQNSPSSSRLASPAFWKRMWSLNVPPKITNFMWRAYKNSLAIK